jgi:hypothetical protein
MPHTGPDRPAFIIYNGKHISLTPSEMKRMPVTGYKLERNGVVRIYDETKCSWHNVGGISIQKSDLNLLSELMGYQKRLIEMMRIPENDIGEDELVEELGLDLEEEEKKIKPQWCPVSIPAIIPNGSVGRVIMWQCPICAATINYTGAKDLHEKYHKTVLCDWWGE